MKFFDRWKNKKLLTYTAAACMTVLFYLVLTNFDNIFGGIRTFFGFIKPVIIGIVIAYVMDPLVKLYQRKLFQKVQGHLLQRNLAVAFSVLSVLAGIVLLMVVLIPQLINSILYLVNHLGTYVQQLESFLGSIAKNSEHPIDMTKIYSTLEQVIEKVTGIIPENLSSIVENAMSIGRNTVETVISFILGIYFLLDKERILNACANFFKVILNKKNYRNCASFWKRCNTIMIRYIIFDILDGIIIGVSNAVFMAIAGIPYIAVISVVVGVTNLAPTFGPIAGGAIGAFILVLVNPWYAFWFLIFTVALQTVDGYVLKPKLFGGTLGVPSIWILICIIVGGRMFGVAGILLAIPFAAIFDFVWRESIVPALRRRRERLDQQAEDRAEQGMSMESKESFSKNIKEIFTTPDEEDTE
ncbi:MAG: AI-2E family transporter [Eubacterium sp.]|nr:AI-2E family transporter [Eubacterium sp.]